MGGCSKLQIWQQSDLVWLRLLIALHRFTTSQNKLLRLTPETRPISLPCRTDCLNNDLMKHIENGIHNTDMQSESGRAKVTAWPAPCMRTENGLYYHESVQDQDSGVVTPSVRTGFKKYWLNSTTAKVTARPAPHTRAEFENAGINYVGTKVTAWPAPRLRDEFNYWSESVTVSTWNKSPQN